MILECGGARVEIDETNGGRLASLQIAGLELLIRRGHSSLDWGCYPMAPWAGRVRNGRFHFEGALYTLPLGMPPHAIHGTVLDRAWTRESDSSLKITLGSDWPWPGSAVQHFRLSATALRMQLELHAAETAYPASIGWHPWFRRKLERGDAAAVHFDAGSVYERDGDGIPTGEKRSPGAGPHDDCFTDLRSAPVIQWPGALELALASTFDHWVLYDEPEHAFCIEPQSGPPDALNLAPQRVTPDAPLVGEFVLEWRPL